MENNEQLEQKAAQAQARLGRDFPAVFYDELRFIDNKEVRFAIDDISYRASTTITDALETLVLSCKGWLEILDAVQLTKTLSERLARLTELLDLERSFFIFPGVGAKPVFNLLPAGLRQSLQRGNAQMAWIPTQRQVTRDGIVEGVDVTGASVLKEAFRKDKQLKTVVVVDDVVATGATLRAFRGLIPMNRDLEYYACCLMMLSPVQNRFKSIGIPSSIDGYRSIIAQTIYQGLSGSPAVNSLSNLTREDDKGQLIRQRYIQRYVDDPDAFMYAIEQLRPALKEMETI